MNMMTPIATATLIIKRRAFSALICVYAVILNGLFTANGCRPKNRAANAYIMRIIEIITNMIILVDIYGLNECFNTLLPFKEL